LFDHRVGMLTVSNPNKALWGGKFRGGRTYLNEGIVSDGNST